MNQSTNEVGLMMQVTDAQKAFAAGSHIQEIGVWADYLLNCHGCSENRPVAQADVDRLKFHILRLQNYVHEVENGSR